MSSSPLSGWSRRELLAASGATAVALAGLTLVSTAAMATPVELEEAIGKLVGKAPVKEGRVNLRLPPIAEDGDVVPLTVSVDSPMSDSDYVRKIHILAQENPWPRVCSFALGPQNGKAEVSTRIRLAKDQTVVAVAEMNDGSAYRMAVAVKVSVGGCGGI
ncbi:thiosulfate oxidation carrier protein SoxY [Methylocapsa aurea]|uniref:thiosulfate oxidation carrier protein SoxY n=1 Tax=Methylocapsa aurea TaxID=663610 RepID=UPI000564C21D|nr:thiosulfate oxidation carrier protein SoxY [Methylocapsa aurea]